MENGYEKVFEHFGQDVIRRRLIVQKEILTLVNLNKLFIQTIKEVEGFDAPYRTWHLKKRLKKTFHQLISMRPSCRNMSDVVFSE